MNDELSKKVMIGTSGWSYDDWRGPFYPEGTQPREYLVEYSRHFETVEVDSTFYAIPSADTFQNWAERTPDGFLFAPKVPGIVTHGSRGERANAEKVLANEDVQLELFVERARILGEKLALILFQFPYFRVKEISSSEFLARLEPTLAKLPSDVRVAVEIRNKTWITPEYLSCLERYRASAVLLDHPYMPPPSDQLERGMVTTDFAYLRLLGDRYAIERKTKKWDRVVEEKGKRLEEWGAVIRALASRAEIRRVFAFANNHYAGHAPATCRDLAERVSVSS